MTLQKIYTYNPIVGLGLTKKIQLFKTYLEKIMMHEKETQDREIIP